MKRDLQNEKAGRKISNELALAVAEVVKTLGPLRFRNHHARLAARQANKTLDEFCYHRSRSRQDFGGLVVAEVVKTLGPLRFRNHHARLAARQANKTLDEFCYQRSRSRQDFGGLVVAEVVKTLGGKQKSLTPLQG